jgi:hypothetical protein
VFRKIRQLLDIVNGAGDLLGSRVLTRASAAAHLHYREASLASDRYADPRRLTRHGWRTYSQFDEDGILAEVFRRLGVGAGTFVEFGVENGTESNSTLLLQAGWSGVWIEGNPSHVAAIRRIFAAPLKAGRLTVREAFVTRENVAALFHECGVPPEPTLLSIDTDGNDWHCWRALSESFRPLVISIEYNAGLGPAFDWVMPYDPDHRFADTRYFGASLTGYERLGRDLGYRLVGCNWYGTNAFFDRGDRAGDHFPDPASAAALWEPPRYELGPPPSGWPKDPREFAG